MEKKSVMRVKLIVVLIGIRSSKDWALMNYSSRVVMVVSDRVETLSAFVFSTLVNWCEGI
jgi:hypothetical protein